MSSKAFKFGLALLLLLLLVLSAEIWDAITSNDIKHGIILTGDFNLDGILTAADQMLVDSLEKGNIPYEEKYFGLFVPVDCNDSDGNGTPDYLDTTPPIDQSDLVKLHLNIPSRAKEVHLIVECDSNRLGTASGALETVRVFSATLQELIGSKHGLFFKYSLPSPEKEEEIRTLYLQGLCFGERFNLAVTVTLEDNTELKQSLPLRCSPFILNPNTAELEDPSDIYVSDENLAQAISATLGAPPTRVGYFYCQSVCEIGYQLFPSAEKLRYESVFLKLIDTPEWKLEATEDTGLFVIPHHDFQNVSALEMGGAIECLPNFNGSDKMPKLGSVLLSASEYLDNLLRKFFTVQAQGIVDVHFKGLEISHVNELLCVIPSHSGASLLYADGNMAARNLPEDEEGEWYVQNSFFCPNYRFTPASIQSLTKKMVKDICSSKLYDPTREKMAKNLNALYFYLNDVGVQRSDVIPVPVLFDVTHRETETGTEGKFWIHYMTRSKKLKYLSASLCNSLPITYKGSNYIFIPYIAEREGKKGIYHDITVSLLKQAGYKEENIVFVNFFPRFMNGGQVGCASNARRKPGPSTPPPHK